MNLSGQIIAETHQQLPWGIPGLRKIILMIGNPRLLNAGWLIDDFEPKHNSSQPFTSIQQRGKREELKRLQEFISKRFPQATILPIGMFCWLETATWGMAQGTHLKQYKEYIPEALLLKSPKCRQNCKIL